MSEPQIRKASESEKKEIIKMIRGDLQNPEICKHRYVAFHSKSNADGFDGGYGNLVGRCLDCDSIILTYYRMISDKILTDKEWIESLYEKRDGLRGYGWYEKDIS